MKTKIIISAFLGLACFITTQGQNVNIPDLNFKSALLNHFPKIDTNNDGQISVAEAQAFTGTIQCNNKNISDLTGIEAFVNTTYLNCSTNQLSSLDLSNNTALTLLDCRFNQLTSLDINNNTALEGLFCAFNQLSSLDVSNNTALTLLNCSDNQLSSLDVSNNTALTLLYCSNNQLSSLDVSNNTALTDLRCQNNQLSSLDVSNNTVLTQLRCNNNQLTSLDLSNNTAFTQLNCRNNQLTSLNLKNGNNTNINTINFDLKNNPNLRCIQVDNVVYSNHSWSIYKDVTACFNENCTPTFNITQTSFCQNATAPVLPAISEDNIIGNWFPATINTSVVGTQTYIFIPITTMSCANPYSIDITVTAAPAPPTGAATQTFNVGQTLADLVVNGDNLLWYSDSALIVNIPNTTQLVNGMTYYAIRQVGDCKSSVFGVMVTDCATLVSQPTGEENQTFNAGQTLADLVVNGNNMVWYPDNTYSNALSLSEPLVDGATFYVRSENGDCQSEALAITVTDCATLVSQPTGEENQTFNAEQTLADLVVNGDNLVWYSDSAYTNELSLNEPLVDEATYYVVSEIGNCQSDALAITVTDCATLNIPTPTGEENQTFNAEQTLADLVVNGDNLVWYSDSAYTNELSLSEPLVDEATYYVVSEVGNCQSEALAITVTDCATLVSQPTGEENQTFNAEQTLADLVINGDNLVWYSDSAYTNELSLSEPLVDGATFYVRSENGNCQSEALAITVEEQASRTNFDIFGFKYYPNPVNDILTFSSNQPIDKVVVSNMLGQEVKANLSSDKTSLDMSNLASGNYLVKVTIEGVSKTIKVVKK